MTDGEFSLEGLQGDLERNDVGWTAGETDMTRLSVSERRLHLGYVPGPEDPDLETRESQAREGFESFQEEAAAPGYEAAYPERCDWRDVDGQSYVGSVADQGSCGSCVAFGCLAAVEGRMRVQRKEPSLAVDLSEAHLFHCHGWSEGRRCDNGWWPRRALRAIMETGVTDEGCYPYADRDEGCEGLCEDWSERTVRIGNFHRATSTRAMKQWLADNGPLVTCYTVYEDFYAYSSGIYRHVSGKREGGHCVCCVGYDDAQQYWICKNSWGPGFGEGGYFRIGYGECGIDGDMWAVDGVQEAGWRRRRSITALYVSHAERNGWAHVDGLGWRQLADGDATSFRVLLQVALTAKTGERLVDLYLAGGKICELYVL